MTRPLPISIAVLLALAFAGGARGQAAPASIADYVNPVAAVPLAELKATRERPLFSATRRPVPTTAVAAPPPPIVIANSVEPPKPPPLELLGTLIGPKDRTAIIITTGAKAANRLREGEVVSGWILVSINPRSAALTRDRRTVTLKLHKATRLPGGSSEEDANADAIAGDALAADAAPADPEPRPFMTRKLRKLIK